MENRFDMDLNFGPGEGGFVLEPEADCYFFAGQKLLSWCHWGGKELGMMGHIHQKNPAQRK